MGAGMKTFNEHIAIQALGNRLEAQLKETNIPVDVFFDSLFEHLIKNSDDSNVRSRLLETWGKWNPLRWAHSMFSPSARAGYQAYDEEKAKIQAYQQALEQYKKAGGNINNVAAMPPEIKTAKEYLDKVGAIDSAGNIKGKGMFGNNYSNWAKQAYHHGKAQDILAPYQGAAQSAPHSQWGTSIANTSTTNGAAPASASAAVDPQVTAKIQNAVAAGVPAAAISTAIDNVVKQHTQTAAPTNLDRYGFDQ
jgi:hypothetical protein